MKDTLSQEEFEIIFFESITKHNPQYLEVLELLGGLYNQQGEFEQALKIDRKLVKLCADNPTAHYNLACSLALSGKRKQALEALMHAVSIGYDDLQWMLKDSELASIRETPQFQSIVDYFSSKNKKQKKATSKESPSKR